MKSISLLSQLRRNLAAPRRNSSQKGVVGIVLLIVMVIAGIVIWIASSGVDSREGARLRLSAIYGSLAQQGQSIANGFSQIVGDGVSPSDVLLTDIYASTVTKAQALPLAAIQREESPLTSATPGMASGNWSLVTVDTDSAGFHVMAVAGPIAPEICSPVERQAGNTTSASSAVFAGTAVLNYDGAPAVEGCIATADGNVYVFPVSRL